MIVEAAIRDVEHHLEGVWVLTRRLDLVELSRAACFKHPLLKGEARDAVKRLLSKGLIRQDSRDRVSWSREDATFYTNPHMRNKIDQTIRAR